MGINWSNMWSLESEPPEQRQNSPAWPLEGEASAESQQEFMERIAQAIVKRRLTVPVLLFLESVRPLSFIGSQALLVLRPMLSLAVSSNDLQALFYLLEERQGVEQLMQLIEKYDKN